MKRTSSRVVVLLLTVVLVSSPGFAAGRSLKTAKEPGLFAYVIRLLHSLIPSLEKAHGTMDPNGQPPANDAHGTMDPDGHA